MFSTIASAIATNVILGWIWRRAQELGSLAAVIVPFYLAMPPHYQAIVGEILSGRGGGLTISAAIGLGWYLWTQFQSWRATTKPQIVTSDKTKIDLSEMTQDEALAAAKAATGKDHVFVGKR